MLCLSMFKYINLCMYAKKAFKKYIFIHVSEDLWNKNEMKFEKVNSSFWVC